jgi:hypothetical protein
MNPNPECPHCGLEVESLGRFDRRKYGMASCSRSNGRVHQVDVVHAGEDRDTALLKPQIVAAMKRTAARYGGKVVPDRDNPGASLLWLE